MYIYIYIYIYKLYIYIYILYILYICKHHNHIRSGAALNLQTTVKPTN